MTLHEFARGMIADDRLLLRPLPSVHSFRGCTEAVLYRDGNLQAELVVVPPNTTINKHRHNRVSSIDLWLCGNIDGLIGSHRLKNQRGFDRLNPTFQPDTFERCLFPIPKGVWHSGTAGEQGVVYISFQEWDGSPSVISDDWEEQ